MTRLIILDRDGVINGDSPAFIKTVEEFSPLPGSLDAVADLKRRGWRVAICSNQSGVGRGLVTPSALAAIHAELQRLLQERGVTLDAIAFCPHRPEDRCDCRKPLPGLILSTMQHLGATPEETIVIGDSPRDLEAGRRAGCRCILVRTGNGRQCEAAMRASGNHEVFDDLRAAATALLDEPSCS